MSAEFIKRTLRDPWVRHKKSPKGHNFTTWTGIDGQKCETYDETVERGEKSKLRLLAIQAGNANV